MCTSKCRQLEDRDIERTCKADTAQGLPIDSEEGAQPHEHERLGVLGNDVGDDLTTCILAIDEKIRD